MGRQRTKEEVELGVPINILWDKMLMLSIIGLLDSKRTQVVMEDMLNKIQNNEAKVVVMDVQGVLAVDSAVANHLIKITKATRLMGCECIISGISPSVSQTIVNLGIELGEIISKATLKDALELAFNKLGFEVTKRK
ncbi:MAG: STAS domain-containing protein [Deltaproteobacteria bacterium]|nr:STAS domain-containing protein [Deltaproteobacteria bacterium]MBW2077769.1 STAS domain-containing protein [Deltaproteobacteria bacterium]MBW2310134.1 STAS domain-containing protein [Deltaproteobacteria bacterium]